MHKRPWEHVWVWMALVIGIIGLSLPRRAYAQLKVGVVALQVVMEHSMRAKAAKERLQALHDQLQHALQAKTELKQHQEAELQGLQTALRTHTEASTTQAHADEVEAYRRRARELQRVIADANQFMADATQELREKEVYETQQLLTAIRQVVRELGEGQGYSLILADGATTAGVLAFTPALDLAPQVIQRVDQTSTDRPGATSGGAPPLAKKH